MKYHLILFFLLVTATQTKAQFLTHNDDELWYGSEIPNEEPNSINAPRPHFTSFRSVTLYSGIGASVANLTLSNNAINDTRGEISPLLQLSAITSKKGVAFQTGLWVTRHNFSVQTVSVENRKLSLTYMEIPLMVRYTFLVPFYVSGGISGAFNVNAKSDFDLETGRPDQGNIMTSIHDTAKNAISNVKACSGYNFKGRMGIQVFYAKALGEILKDGSDGKTFSFVGAQLEFRIRNGSK